MPDAARVWGMPEDAVKQDTAYLKHIAEDLGLIVVSDVRFRESLVPFTVSLPGDPDTLDRFHVGELYSHQRLLSSRFHKRYQDLLFPHGAATSPRA